jgi:hypothetical protein
MEERHEWVLLCFLPLFEVQERKEKAFSKFEEVVSVDVSKKQTNYH